MALQLGLLHEALKAAGAGDDLARRASEEVAEYENRLVALDQAIGRLRAYADQQFTQTRAELSALRAYVDQQFAQARAELSALRAYVDHRFNLLSWMVGVNSALVLAVFVKLFVH